MLLTPAGPAGQSAINALAPAADAIEAIGTGRLARAVKRRPLPKVPGPPPPPAPRPRVTATPTPAHGAPPLPRRPGSGIGSPAPRPPAPPLPTAEQLRRREQVEDAAARFAVRWSLTVTNDYKTGVVAQQPHIPPDIDRDLLRFVEDAENIDLREAATERTLVRAAFWRALATLQR